jgi:Reverse transcriptase (RNA-dependent DNA polymerase)
MDQLVAGVDGDTENMQMEQLEHEGEEAQNSVQIPGVQTLGLQTPGVQFPGVQIPGVPPMLDTEPNPDDDEESQDVPEEENEANDEDLGEDSDDESESDRDSDSEIEIQFEGPGEGNAQPPLFEVETVAEEEEQDDEINAIQQAIEEEMDLLYGPRNGPQNLRPRRPRNFEHRYQDHVMLTQYSMKAGLKIYGDRAKEAVMKELLQLHERKVMQPMDASKMSAHDKWSALSYLMFVKEKRSGVIKGRGCADGRKQRGYITKEESSLPTVMTESVFITGTIDALERRDVATVDLPGAFMQADMDDIIYMRLEGIMVELLLEIDHALYAPFVCKEKGKDVIYVQLIKALYGTLKAAMLFWKKLTETLVGWGFEVNPYDWCVANKIVNGSQCTIVWHVDDLKISHKDEKVVSDVIKQLQGEFGKEAPLTVNRGKIHDYLGMTLDFSEEGKLKVLMVDYIKGMLDELPSDMDGTVVNPAASDLFEINEGATKLDTAQSEFFHRHVAKLLFLCKRARPDIQPAISFLCTRVQAPDVDDYKKLTRVMQFLRGTVDDPLTLEADGTGSVNWWADASFAVHHDARSHTGGCMSMGRGTVYGTSTRQKINTRSSTEAELVAANDVMAQLMWTQHFLEAQGYLQKRSTLFQDNKSAILLEKNGRASSSKRTRHLNIRYFFITDKVKHKELTIEYCPTKQMIADFFTKPLQGSLFTWMRNHQRRPQECVGK